MDLIELKTATKSTDNEMNTNFKLAEVFVNHTYMNETLTFKLSRIKFQ